MIQTLFRNTLSFNILTVGLILLLSSIALLMAGVIVSFCFPTIGEILADWVGNGRFAAFIQLLY